MNAFTQQQTLDLQESSSLDLCTYVMALQLDACADGVHRQGASSTPSRGKLLELCCAQSRLHRCMPILHAAVAEKAAVLGETRPDVVLLFWCLHDVLHLIAARPEVTDSLCGWRHLWTQRGLSAY
jgi:hypothetical protein